MAGCASLSVGVRYPPSHSPLSLVRASIQTGVLGKGQDGTKKMQLGARSFQSNNTPRLHRGQRHPPSHCCATEDVSTNSGGSGGTSVVLARGRGSDTGTGSGTGGAILPRQRGGHRRCAPKTTGGCPPQHGGFKPATPRRPLPPRPPPPPRAMPRVARATHGPDGRIG